MEEDFHWTTCLRCGSGLLEYELCPECGYCTRCCECDHALVRLLQDLQALVQALREEARRDVPEEYQKRGLEYKYLAADNYAAGLDEAAARLEELIARYKPE